MIQIVIYFLQTGVALKIAGIFSTQYELAIEVCLRQFLIKYLLSGKIFPESELVFKQLIVKSSKNDF